MFFKGIIIIAAIALGAISVSIMSSYDFGDSQYFIDGLTENDSEKIISDVIDNQWDELNQITAILLNLKFEVGTYD